MYKSFIAFGSIFGLIGLLSLSIGAFNFVSTRTLLNKAIKTSGTVENIDRQYSQNNSGGQYLYYPTVSFTTGNNQKITFESELGANPPQYSTGETVPVIYDPANPNHASIDSFMEHWFTASLLLGLGTIFFGIGGGILLYVIKSKIQDDWLTQHGQTIQAQIQSVTIDESTTMDGKNPYKIAAQWLNPVNQEVYVFYSHPIWFDPTSFIQNLPNKIINVLIDPANPKRYLVNLSFLPKQAI